MLYRHTWNKWYGDFYYPLPPAYYHWKAKLLKLVTPLEKIFISELQLEPWGDKSPAETPINEQLLSMNNLRFTKNVDFARQVGFSEIYFWGAEWWYWMKEKQNNDSFWQQAILIFKNQNND